MEKNEYLELAKQKGWDTKIPQLEDGTYDCDVFGGDGVMFDFAVFITGTLYLKDEAYFLNDVSANAGIFLGNNAYTLSLSSDNGDVIIGNDAGTCSIIGKNIICGDNLETNWENICAEGGFVILGKNSPVYEDGDEDHGTVYATEDIICDDEPAV